MVRRRGLFRGLLAFLIAAIAFLTNACDLPRVEAQERMFLDLSLEFLDEYQLPRRQFEQTPVRGLSDLAYDRQTEKFYAISDDRSIYAPARFYTLDLELDDNLDRAGIRRVNVEKVTYLKNEDGQTYPWDGIDPEGITLSPQNSVFVASEGFASKQVDPFVGEFDRDSGQLLHSLPLPKFYIPDAKDEDQTVGIRENLGFEALALNGGFSTTDGEPFRVFVGTESALLQDLKESEDGAAIANARLLHYLILDGKAQLLAEHAYPLDGGKRWSLVNGLTALVALDGGSGHFLSLERSFGFLGYGAKIYQVATGSATDISSFESIKNALDGIKPARKKLMLDLSDLGITLDNLEGMTLGPRLPDGSQSLVLVSDDNFEEAQVTQFLLFRIRKN